MLPETVTGTPDLDWLTAFTWVWLLLALPIAACLCFINAPYGRHNPGTWGALIHARLGWLLMESPAVLIPAGFFVWMRGWESPVMLTFFLIWQSHYVYRAWIYPLHLAKASSPMPVLLMLMGLAFNLVNGRSEEHTSELQSRTNLVCRLLLEKKKFNTGPGAENNDDPS